MQTVSGAVLMDEREVLALGGDSFWFMKPAYEDMEQTLVLDKELTLLKIKANPVDPILFQTFFCVECADFIAMGGLFPRASTQHRGHHLAWLPGVDEPTQGKPANLIAKWIAKTDLTAARRQWLSEIPTRNAMNWAWVCNEDEYEDWADYLDTYLDELAESWLAALNGKDSELLEARSIWQLQRPRNIYFRWSED